MATITFGDFSAWAGKHGLHETHELAELTGYAKSTVREKPNSEKAPTWLIALMAVAERHGH